MKKILFSLLLYLLGINILFAQTPNAIKIHYTLSQQLKAGNKVDLKVMVEHHLSKEQTGNEKFTTQFPFTVPAEYHGKFILTLKAICGDAKDSVTRIFDIGSKITGHE